MNIGSGRGLCWSRQGPSWLSTLTAATIANGDICAHAFQFESLPAESPIEDSAPNRVAALHDLRLEPRLPIGAAASTISNWRFRPPMVVSGPLSPARVASLVAILVNSVWPLGPERVAAARKAKEAPDARLVAPKGLLAAAPRSGLGERRRSAAGRQYILCQIISGRAPKFDIHRPRHRSIGLSVWNRCHQCSSEFSPQAPVRPTLVRSWPFSARRSVRSARLCLEYNRLSAGYLESLLLEHHNQRGGCGGRQTRRGDIVLRVVIPVRLVVERAVGTLGQAERPAVVIHQLAKTGRIDRRTQRRPGHPQQGTTVGVGTSASRVVAAEGLNGTLFLYRKSHQP